MQDIFKTAADSQKDVFEEMTEDKPKRSFSGNKKENYWEKTDIEAMGIDVTKFNRTGKSFVVYVHPENDLPAEAVANITKVVKALVSNGYTFRYTGSSKSMLHNQLCQLEGASVDYYLPWKGFNKTVANPSLPNPTGYKIAMGIHGKYMKLSPTVRAIIAKDVNAILGDEATDPVDFVVAWTTCGTEVIGKGVDYKTLGPVSFVLDLSKKASIPVLNVGNNGFVDKFKELIS